VNNILRTALYAVLAVLAFLAVLGLFHREPPDGLVPNPNNPSGMTETYVVRPMWSVADYDREEKAKEDIKAERKRERDLEKAKSDKMMQDLQNKSDELDREDDMLMQKSDREHDMAIQKLDREHDMATQRLDRDDAMLMQDMRRRSN